MREERAGGRASAALIGARVGLAGGVLFGLWEARGAIDRAPFFFLHLADALFLFASSALLHGCAAALLLALLLRAVEGIVRARGGPPGHLRGAAWALLAGGLLLVAGAGRGLGAPWEAASLSGLLHLAALAGAALTGALGAFGAAAAWARLPAAGRAGRLLWAASFVALLATGFATLPGEGAPGGEKRAAARAIGDNLLLVTIDTLRPDHLGCYGNPGLLTPSIDRLARAGVLFADAVAAIPITLPSHCTIMTSTLPATHGVRDNGRLFRRDDLPLLSSLLAARGYATGAMIAAFPLDAYFGLSRGFDDYDDRTDPLGMRENLRRTVALVTVGRLLERAGISLSSHRVPERRADEVTAAALDWLGAHRDRPFFLWVHYYDPHAPYDPPPPYDHLYAGGRPPTLGGGSLDGIEVLHHMRIAGARDLREYRARYDGEVAFADRSAGALFSYLARTGLDEKTLVVLAADHGEGLGQHREMGHTTRLYEEQLRVPLIIRPPGGRGGGRVVAGTVRLVDVAPTVLALLGAPPPETMEGRSLVPLMRGGRLPPAGAYAETPLAGGRRMLRAGPWKMIEESSSGRVRLYDLDEDPGETRDLAGDPGVRGVLGTLEEEIASYPSLAGREEEGGPLPEEIRERLKALGYVR